MLARLDPRFLPRLWFPLGDQGKDETRAEARAAGLEAAKRAESQEACFLAGGDYRDFLARHGLAAARARSSTRRAGSSGATTASGASRPASGAGSASPRGAGVRRCAPSRARTRSSSARASRSPAHEVRAGTGRLFVPVDRVDAKLRYRSPATAASVAPLGRGFRLALDEPAYGVAAGQAAVLYEGDAVVGAGLITASS